MHKLRFIGKVLQVNTHISPISTLRCVTSARAQAFLLHVHYYFMHFLPLEKTTTQRTFFSLRCPQPGAASGRKHFGAPLKLHLIAQSQSQQLSEQSAHCKYRYFLCFLIEFLSCPIKVAMILNKRQLYLCVAIKAKT